LLIKVARKSGGKSGKDARANGGKGKSANESR